MRRFFKLFSGLFFFLGIALMLPRTAMCAILFQNDDFATTESDNLVINSDNGAGGNLTLQFGQSLGEYLRWNSGGSLFELSDDLDLGSNQLMSARMENAASLPGGAGGLGAGGTGRIVQLTATDSTAPGCTVSPYCVAGTYMWNGTIWKNLDSGGSPGGNTNDVQYNTGSAFGGEDALEYDAANNQLTVPGLSLNEDFGLTGDISPSQLTSDQNNWNPTGLSTAGVIRVSGDSSFRSITGIANGADGRVLQIVNVGSNSLFLVNQSTSSSAANRFDLGGYDIPLFPSDAVIMQYDETSSRWRIAKNFAHVIPPAGFGYYKRYNMLDSSTDRGVFSTVSGTDAANSVTAVTNLADHPGVVEHQTGTTTTGRASYTSNAGTLLIDNNYYWRFEALVRIPTLSDGTNTFMYRAGFVDSNSNEGSDGCYFRYTHSQASGQWQGVCRSNGTESTTSGTTVVANTWYRLTVIVNPAGNVAKFFVDGTQIGSNITTNIPTGAGRDTGYGSALNKSAGTTSRGVDIDYMEVIFYKNTP
jgi:hypothetical protein